MTSDKKTAIHRLSLATLLVFISSLLRASDDMSVEYHASVTGQLSSKSLAPYMLGSWNLGRYVEGNGAWQEGGLLKRLDSRKRFDWSVGFDYMAGVGEKTEYRRWDIENQSWGENSARRNAFRITQLFGQLKYRQTTLILGMTSFPSKIVDGSLSSGDLTRSINASPIPGVSAGFIDFVDIPFTQGWLQINGEIMYGKMMDSRFKRREFNQYAGIEALNIYYHYKRCYFRTNPDKPFHVTLGLQAAGMFGGDTYLFYRGSIVKSEHHGLKWSDVFQMFFPREGGENYYTGNHLGSWDFKATYNFRDGSGLHAYFEWPWEDGSGVGRMNGWDGLWGIQYDFRRRGIVTKALVEYLDFTNQSGPVHFDPEDNPHSGMSGHAQGADNYYNNDYYGAYTNYGMGIGSPFLVAPIYNRDGMLSYLHNRARGFHAALEGEPNGRVSYRLMAGYAKAGGSGWVPDFKRTCSVSGMLEGRLRPITADPGFELGLRMAFDKGELRGDNFGMQVQVSYSGCFKFKRSSK